MSDFDLWRKLGEIWAADIWLRSELWSGRDVLQIQRVEGNYKLTVCQERTPGSNQGTTWIHVEPILNETGLPESPENWQDLKAPGWLFALYPKDERLEIGSVGLISGMPNTLYGAWHQTNDLFNGQLVEQLSAETTGISKLLDSAGAATKIDI